MVRQAQLKNATPYLLRRLKDGATQAKIAEELGINKSNVSRRLRLLERKGLIVLQARDVFKIWALTAAGKEVLKGVAVDEGCSEAQLVRFRWHHLLFKVPIIGSGVGVSGSEFVDAGFSAGGRGCLNGFGVKWGDSKVFVTAKSVLIFARVEAGSIEGALQAGLREQERVCDRLLRLFPRLKLFARWELCRQHFAWQGAFTDCVPAGWKWESERLVIDFSTGSCEVETVNKKYAVEDMFDLSSALDDFARGEWKAIKARVLAEYAPTEFDLRDRI